MYSAHAVVLHSQVQWRGIALDSLEAACIAFLRTACGIMTTQIDVIVAKNTKVRILKRGGTGDASTLKK